MAILICGMWTLRAIATANLDCQHKELKAYAGKKKAGKNKQLD